jgi:hypothetical protein
MIVISDQTLKKWLKEANPQVRFDIFNVLGFLPRGPKQSSIIDKNFLNFGKVNRKASNINMNLIFKSNGPRTKQSSGNVLGPS